MSSFGERVQPLAGGLDATERQKPIRGRITSVTLGEVMAEVTIDIGNGNVLTSAITRGSAVALKLAVGDQIMAVIKSTEIIIAK